MTTPRSKSLRLRLGAPLIFLVFAVAVWQLAVSQAWISEVIVPPPYDVVSAFVELVTGGLLWEHLWATTFETVAGFLLGSVAAVSLAMLSGLSVTLRSMLYPYVVSLQVTPLIAIAPIIVAWLGFGYSSKFTIAALICFFPVFVNTLTGVLAVDEDAREMFRSLGASRRETFTKLLLPSALPVIFAGLKTAMTLALIGAVVGEFISARVGLGLLVQRFSYQLAVADAFAVVFILMFLGLAFFGAMAALNRVIVFWPHDERLAARSRRKAARARGRFPPARSAEPQPAEDRSTPPLVNRSRQ